MATHALNEVLVSRSGPRGSFACAVAIALATHWARADGVPRTEAIDIVGTRRTREETILDLLPRRPPASYTDAEIEELERRINNLAIFDDVEVERSGDRLRITVREKWTLIPSIDFASGETLKDSFAMLTLTEFNAFGTANQAGAAVFHEQRGWGFTAGYAEHIYRRKRWSFGGEASFSSASYRFEDGNEWRSNLASATVVMTSPPSFSEYFNQRVGLSYTRETIHDVQGPTRPPNSHVVQTFLGFSWDRYRWRDLVPYGMKAELILGSGLLAGPPVPQPRHSAEFFMLGAVPFGRTTVVMSRLSASVMTRGNPLFSALLGSIQGVRGLDDALYRNWVQTFVNVELRQSLPIASRWALQGVVFADGALFERITAEGGRGEKSSAFAAGVGGRVIPTWLAGVVLRVDVSRLLQPEQRWFYQIGLSQYF